MTDNQPRGTEAAPPERRAEAQGIQVLARAADILRALKADNSGLSLGRIALRVGLPRSTVQRIVNALVAERLVVPNTLSGGFQLGPEIQALAEAGRQDVAQALRPAIEAVSRETGETVDLAVFRNDGMVFVDQAVGAQRLRAVSAIGESFPMTVTANGKAALAWLDLVDVARIAAKERRRLDAGKTMDAVRSEIRATRERGYALDLDEHTTGISAAGLAFRVGGAVYAVSIPVPSQRFRGEREVLLERLLSLRTAIARALPEAEFR